MKIALKVRGMGADILSILCLQLFSDELADWIADYFKNKPLFELEEFVFMK